MIVDRQPQRADEFTHTRFEFGKPIVIGKRHDNEPRMRGTRPILARLGTLRGQRRDDRTQLPRQHRTRVRRDAAEKRHRHMQLIDGHAPRGRADGQRRQRIARSGIRHQRDEAAMPTAI